MKYFANVWQQMELQSKKGIQRPIGRMGGQASV
jgi:hypothetical protein